MPTTGLLLGWIAVLNLAIGFYVYRRNTTAPANRAFAFTAGMIGVWTGALAWGRLQPHSFDMAIRTAFCAGSLCPFGILLLVEHFGATATIHKRRLQLLAVVAVTLSALSFTPWMVSSVTREPYGMRPLYGFLHPLLAAYVVATFTLAAVALVQQYRHFTGIQKTQVGHLFLAFIVPGVLAATTNVFVPLIARTSAYNGLGPIFSLAMIAMIAHAIIRHRLMDIRVVIRRGFVYLVTFLGSAALFVILLFGSNFLLPLEQGFSLRDILLALIVAFAFHSVKTQVQHLFDLYLYREPYNYAQTLRDASRALTATIDLQRILQHVGTALASVLRPEGMSIHVLDPEDREFRMMWSTGLATSEHAVPATSLLISSVGAHRQLLFLDEITGIHSPDRDRLLQE
ncbi:MAG TPA: histidine kinase N-terminal 7TM domain-containing protein, partial [Nitrospiraceae bacterium]